MPRELETKALQLVQDVVGGIVQRTPSWLVRPGKQECGKHWWLICDIYHALTGFVLPESMPPRENRNLDCVLKIGTQPARVIEVDEIQHFNGYRAKTLRMYPDVPVAFDRSVWIRYSEAKVRLEGGGFGKPMPPLFPGQWGRHKQRAFRDALADILPADNDFLPTLRIAYFEVADWISSSNAYAKMQRLLDDKFRCTTTTECL